MAAVIAFLFHILFNLINIILFLQAFCPFHHTNINITNIEPPVQLSSETKPFAHTILMVIDALRLDFVDKKYMPLTSDLIDKHGCLMNVKVASPTVTLPRIKALTTGNVPQFIDVFYNLGTPGYVEDSILHRALKRGKKIVFYGDDTWIKIFPRIFARQEGTSSFFVTDFYEVDNNVTRHLDGELKRADWDIMILHYLGLDHIGHVHGPFSPPIRPKLQEMDKIFSMLFQKTSKLKGNSLFLLTGDHGMKDSGGHGGSTYSETHVPLVILGAACTNGSIDQVDIAPNIAALLNIEIPHTSIGKLHRNILNKFTIDQYLSLLHYNSELLKMKHSLCNDRLDLATQLYKSYLTKNELNDALKAIELYEECSKEISDALIKASVRQNIPSMIVSVIFECFLLSISLNNFNVITNISHSSLLYVIFLLVRIFINEYFALVTIILAFLFQLLKSNLFQNFKLYGTATLCLLVIFLQPLTWLSSSFIEEEQEYWYFFLNTLILFQVFKQLKHKNKFSFISWLFISFSFRFVQTLNQTGDKWASLPDTSDFLVKPENYLFLFSLSTTSIFSIYYLCCIENYDFYSFKLNQVIIVLLYLFKLDVLTHVYIVRIIYILVLLNVIFSKNCLNFWILIISLLSKSHNLCMIPLCVYTSGLIMKDYGNGIFSIVIHLLLAKSFFFMQGNGNSLANVDVTVGYLGLDSYQPILVGIQLLISVYSFTILVHLLIMRSLMNNESFIKLLHTKRSCAMIVICLVSLFFRNHISVWTIYAPKLFIEFSHTVIIYVELIFYKLFSTKRETRSSSKV